MIKYKLLADFNTPGAESRWEVINDAVMGGLSESRLTGTAAAPAVFEGKLSLDNGRGFASIRTYIGDLLLDGFKGLAVRLKGDGRRYRFRVRTEDAPEGFAYQVIFGTQPDAWATIYLTFAKFEPFFRGEAATGAPPLNPGDIRQIGLMIADEQPGAFRLEIDWIKAYLDY